MTPTPFDPDDLPILSELEHAYRRMVVAELRTSGPPHTTATTRGTSPAPSPPATSRGTSPAPSPPTAALPSPSPSRGRPSHAAPSTPARRHRDPRPALSAGRRVLGRAVAAGALVGVVGATALATKSVVHPDGPGGPEVLERRAAHELTLRPYQGRSCLDVTYDGGVASRCAEAPGGAEVVPVSAITPGGRVVAGLAGPAVARVVVRSGGRHVTAATHSAPDGALRWFAVVLPPLAHEANRAATIAPRRADGTAAGPVAADCTLGTAASCATAREHSGGPDVNGP